MNVELAASNPRGGQRAVTDLRPGDRLSVIRAEPTPLDFAFIDHRVTLHLIPTGLLHEAFIGCGDYCICPGKRSSLAESTSLSQYAQTFGGQRNLFTWVLPLDEGQPADSAHRVSPSLEP
jgi:hypothetical protein